MIRNILRFLVFASFVTFAATLVYRALHGTRVTTETEESARRFLVYTAAHDEGPRFAFDEGSGVVRLVTYLHLPGESRPDTYRPETRYEYALVIRVLGADGKRVIHEKTVWISTRKSKANFENNRWLLDSAFYPAGTNTGEPTDSRMVDIDLREFRAPGRILEFRSLGPTPDPIEVDLIAFDQYRRTESRIDWMMQTLGAQRSREIAESTGLASWTSPNPTEIRKYLEAGWRRMTALETAANRTIVTTDYRRPFDDSSSGGLDVANLRGVAYNLVGPAQLEIGASWPAGIDAYPITMDVLRSSGDDLEVERRSETLRERRRHSFETSSGDSSSLRVAVAAGEVASIRIETPETPGRIFASVNRAGAIAGEHPATVSSDGSIALGPDLKRFKAWGPTEPLVYTLSDDSDVRVHDAILVSLRRPAGTPATRIQYRFVGTDVRGQLSNAAPDSKFERVATQEAELRLTEPEYHRLWIPRGARAIEIRARNPRQWLTVATLSTDELVERAYRSPYDQAPVGLEWRYGPLRENSWMTIFPDTQVEPATILAQARLEPDLSTTAGATIRARLVDLGLADPKEETTALGEARTLEPIGRPRRGRIIEPAAATDEGKLRLRMTNEQPIDCRTGPAQTVNFILQAREQSLGRPYSVLWNGEPLRRRLVRTTYDRFLISVPSVSGELSIEYPGGGSPLVAYVDCEPRGRDGWRVRNVFRLEDALEVRVSAPEEGTHYLNAVVYGPRRGVIEAIVDGGEPDRRVGSIEQITLSQRVLEWVPAASNVELLGPEPVPLDGPFPFSIPIGSDLASGTHRVTLKRAEGTRGPIWVRFFEYR